MAIAFKVFVLNLVTEFFAHAFVFGKFPYLARAIAVFLAQTFLNFFNVFFIVVKSYFHSAPVTIYLTEKAHSRIYAFKSSLPKCVL